MLKHLHDDPDCDFKILVDICGIDWPQRAKRFDVVYHLLSLTKNHAHPRQGRSGRGRSRSNPCVAALSRRRLVRARSLRHVRHHRSTDHPDLRRILTDYGFSGYPLRKDFPLTGYVELRYDDELKRVVYQPVQLVQEFRDFDFMSPWEGAPHILPGDEKAAMAPNATSGDPGKKP